MSKSFCDGCCFEHECSGGEAVCKAADALHKICAEQDIDHKAALIRGYAKQLGVIEYEVSEQLQELGDKVIDGMPDLAFIRDFDIKVGFVISYVPKRQDLKAIMGQCRKVTGVDTAYLPFNFIIVFYQPNITYMTENQLKVLMYHELKHIGMGPKGLRIEPHDIEDFGVIISRYGLKWDGFGNDVSDIVAGVNYETEKDAG